MTDEHGKKLKKVCAFRANSAERIQPDKTGPFWQKKSGGQFRPFSGIAASVWRPAATCSSLSSYFKTLPRQSGGIPLFRAVPRLSIPRFRTMYNKAGQMDRKNCLATKKDWPAPPPRSAHPSGC
jgi:hypothetical protein